MIPLRRALLAAAVASVAAAGQPGMSAAGELAGTKWRVVEIGGAPLANAGSMEIHADSLSGRAPCNQYAASLAAENGRFALSAVRVTRMACPRLEEEERFFGALERVRSYRRDGAALLLLDDAGESALRLESE